MVRIDGGGHNLPPTSEVNAGGQANLPPEPKNFDEASAQVMNFIEQMHLGPEQMHLPPAQMHLVMDHVMHLHHSGKLSEGEAKAVTMHLVNAMVFHPGPTIMQIQKALELKEQPLGPGGEQHLLGPGGEQKPTLGPGGTQQQPLGPGGEQHLLGPGGTQQPTLGPGGEQHLLGPGGTQQQPLGPGGEQHLLGPGGTEQPQSMIFVKPETMAKNIPMELGPVINFLQR